MKILYILVIIRLLFCSAKCVNIIINLSGDNLNVVVVSSNNIVSVSVTSIPQQIYVVDNSTQNNCVINYSPTSSGISSSSSSIISSSSSSYGQQNSSSSSSLFDTSSSIATASSSSLPYFHDTNAYSVSKANGLGLTFDGLGALSASGTYLLYSYPTNVREQILDYLFLPNFGASLQVLKVDIGGGGDDTSGSEPTHMFSPSDLNMNRGFEWDLMKSAKQRNPNIKLWGLSWSWPGWVCNNGVDCPLSTLAVNYTVQWLLGAQRVHNLTIDYVGIWNERSVSMTYVVELYAAIVQSGLTTRVEVGDQYLNWLCSGILGDSSYENATYAVSAHYPDTSTDPTCTTLGKPIWSSEDIALGYNSAGQCIARTANQNLVRAGITLMIMWPIIGGWYSILPYGGDGLIQANTPYSQAYSVGHATWAFAHTTQFTSPGWQYFLPQNGTGLLTFGGSYVALTNGVDFTLVIEKMSSVTSTCGLSYPPPAYNTSSETAIFQLDPTVSSYVSKLYMFSSDMTAGTATTDFTFNGIIPVNSTGLIVIPVAVGQIITLSTINGTKGSYDSSGIPNIVDIPTKWSDTFDNYTIDSFPQLFIDQYGSFVIANSQDPLTTSYVLTQQMPNPCVSWTTVPINPFSMIGYNTLASQQIASYVYLTGTDPLAFLSMYIPAGPNGLPLNSMQAVTLALVNTTVALLKNYNIISQYIITSSSFSLVQNSWYYLALVVTPFTVYGYLDHQLVLSAPYASFAPLSGISGIGSGFNYTEFNNFSIGPATDPAYYYNTATSQSSFIQYIQSLSPTSYWVMNEASGPWMYDWSGNQNTAAYSQYMGYQGCELTSNTNGSASFKGNSSSYAVATGLLQNPLYLSYGLFFNTTSTTGATLMYFNSNHDSTLGNDVTHFILILANGALRVYEYTSNQAQITTSGTYNDGRIHFAVVTVSSSSGVTLYVDGSSVGTAALPSGYTLYTGNWAFGGSASASPGGGWLVGLMGHVMIFDSVLTGGQVSAIWTAAGTLPASCTTNPTPHVSSSSTSVSSSASSSLLSSLISSSFSSSSSLPVFLININVGGTTQTLADGSVWVVGDGFFTNPTTAYSFSATPDTTPVGSHGTNPVSGTELYPTSGNTLNFSMPIANGVYSVSLIYLEAFLGRSLSATVNEQAVASFDTLDTFVMPLIFTTQVTVTNNVVNISVFGSSSVTPELNAISICACSNDYLYTIGGVLTPTTNIPTTFLSTPVNLILGGPNITYAGLSWINLNNEYMISGGTANISGPGIFSSLAIAAEYLFPLPNGVYNLTFWIYQPNNYAQGDTIDGILINYQTLLFTIDLFDCYLTQCIVSGIVEVYSYALVLSINNVGSNPTNHFGEASGLQIEPIQ